MSKVSMLARLVAQDGKGDELVAAFEDLFRQVESEPGTELYVLNRSSSEPDVFWFYELYADGDALAAHAGSEAMQKAATVFGPLLGQSELVMGAPVRAKGIDT
ncbi:MAG TPA: antibiotic biosynthesis monooxygenase family protein [Acidimicrobiia bacterium]|nr:antibiotic biosynthesis monooxygenase family protein [Acidimicrobiia bacterium]